MSWHAIDHVNIRAMGKETYLKVTRVLLLCATFNIAAAWPAAADSVLVRGRQI